MRAIPEIDDEEHLAIIDGGFSSQLSAEITSLPVPPPSAPKHNKGKSLKSVFRIGNVNQLHRLQIVKIMKMWTTTTASEDDDFQAPRKPGKHQIIEHLATKAIYLF